MSAGLRLSVGFFSRGLVSPRTGFFGQMRSIKLSLVWLLLALAPFIGRCAVSPETQAGGAVAHAEGAQHEEGLTPHAVELWTPELPGIGRFPITNSMIVTWAVALGLIVFSQVATRNMKEIPSGIQNFWEWPVEGLYTFLEGIIGH